MVTEGKAVVSLVESLVGAIEIGLGVSPNPLVTVNYHQFQDQDGSSTVIPIKNISSIILTYENVLVSPAAITTVKNLCHNPIRYAVELIKQAKTNVTEEYIKSTADLIAIRGNPHAIGSYRISNLMHIGFENVDFGWGKAVFGGPANAVGLVSFFIPTKNKEGQVRTLVPICLPASAMERFSNELDNILIEG
ncbi:hypothetical protein J1N35_042680 [Gossypium stocksii]|uniref:Benzyl alcohol O-benzoyltransferase n=1 Tax=Gossypium stocksii TaxID=47602 RepID=A0A9D3U5X9_9ROSI|nr:hypothetical protein J1N35_042680 [Gossypium stocksii]